MCIFMKFMESGLAPLQLQGIRVLNYIIDLRRLVLRLNIKSEDNLSRGVWDSPSM